MFSDKRNNLYKSLTESISRAIASALFESELLEAKEERPKWIEYNEENVEHYKTDRNLLRHARVNKNTFGWMIVKGRTLVGYCGCEDDKIIALEVMPRFRRRKYATKLIKKAVDAGCTQLSVEKNNRPAIGLYFKNGFYIFGSNKHQLFMQLRSLKKSNKRKK